MRKSAVGLGVALATLALAALAVVATGSAADQSKQAPIKAAWIYVGPINDGGWTQAHNEGREAVEEELGDAVETTYKENIPEGPEAKQVMRDLIADGNEIIFATSFGYGDALAERPRKYPDVQFEHATGVRPPARTCHLLRRLRGHDLPDRHRRRRRHPRRRHGRLRRPVPDPRGDPPHQRLRARRAERQPRGHHQGRVDQHLVRPRGRAPGGRQPHRRRRRRHRLRPGLDSPPRARRPARRTSRSSATTRTRASTWATSG